MKVFITVVFLLQISVGAYAQSDGKMNIQFIKPILKNDSIGYNKNKIKLIPAPDFSTQHFGFFCKQEMKFEKRTSIPLKIRLGNLSYCNYLEQKTGYKLPEQ